MGSCSNCNPSHVVIAEISSSGEMCAFGIPVCTGNSLLSWAACSDARRKGTPMQAGPLASGCTYAMDKRQLLPATCCHFNNKFSAIITAVWNGAVSYNNIPHSGRDSTGCML